MQLTPEQQQAVESQKQNCPFCKIVKGEIPTKKIYEDEIIIAILDINPANKGHTLLMPKEHYPIMPLVPPNIIEHLALKTKEISLAVKEGMLVFGNNIFIANGIAAGQQSQHFMLHIIPREENDGITQFDLKVIEPEEKQQKEAFRILSNNLPIMLKERYKLFPLEGKAPKKTPMHEKPIAYTKEELLKLIEQNPQLRQAITQNPEQFRQLVPNNPQLKGLFANVDIEEIIKEVAGKKVKQNIQYDFDRAGLSDEKDTTPKTEETKKDTIGMVTAEPQIKEDSAEEEYIFNVLDENPRMKYLLISDIETLKQKTREIYKLQELFSGIDLDELRLKVIEREKKRKEESKEAENADLDEFSKAF